MYKKTKSRKLNSFKRQIKTLNISGRMSRFKKILPNLPESFSNMMDNDDSKNVDKTSGDGVAPMKAKQFMRPFTMPRPHFLQESQ